MTSINDSGSTAKQYANADGLNTRILLHQKYSVNKQPYGDWISEHYRIKPGMKVLELGCGTGSMWAEPSRWLPPDASLLLTDLSAGMLATAKTNVPAQPNISFAQADIQNIPCEDGSFDLVIANAMLYHVPDLDKALHEVSRVLRPEGRFVCSTTGDNGLHAWLQKVLGAGESPAMPFTLQNGGTALSKYFSGVEMRIREDALEVTDADDLIAYILSMSGFGFVKEWPPEALASRLNAQAVDGVIRIPKEYGLFICSNAKKE